MYKWLCTTTYGLYQKHILEVDQCSACPDALDNVKNYSRQNAWVSHWSHSRNEGQALLARKPSDVWLDGTCWEKICLIRYYFTTRERKRLIWCHPGAAPAHDDRQYYEELLYLRLSPSIILLHHIHYTFVRAVFWRRETCGSWTWTGTGSTSDTPELVDTTTAEVPPKKGIIFAHW